MAAVLSFVALGMPAMAAEEGEFIFFGVVTVRDGKTVLFQNPDLTKEQVALCRDKLKHFLGLDRTFTTSKYEKGGLKYEWGSLKGGLAEDGLVPYVAYFVTPNQYVSLTAGNAEPRALNMIFQRGSTPGIASLRWWAPETTEKCDLSLEYYDDSSYKAVATLKDDEIGPGPSGKSPDGVNWKVTGIEPKGNGLVVKVETDEGPEGHQFVFWIATKRFKTPRQTSPSPQKTEDGKGFVYSVFYMVKSEEELGYLDIRERLPERTNTWEAKGFLLRGK